MPDSSFLKLSPFVARSRRSFAHGAVGLGIVAALSGGRGRPATLTRSEPIPIGPSRASAATRPPERDEAELSESYTCVISHVGGNVSKRVYLGDGSKVSTGDFRRGRAVLFEPPLPPPKPAMPLPAMDFLSHCYLCKKKLEGIDIYMYRGDKAFCSPECRCHQMLVDAHRENYGSGVPKLLECSLSPSSAPLLSAAGTAAA